MPVLEVVISSTCAGKAGEGGGGRAAAREHGGGVAQIGAGGVSGGARRQGTERGAIALPHLARLALDHDEAALAQVAALHRDAARAAAVGGLKGPAGRDAR